MPQFKVRVQGQPPPGRSGGKARHFLARIKAVWLWLLHRPAWLVLGGLLAFVLTVGTPHIRWYYECRYRPGVDAACRYYGFCEYYGIQGKRVLFYEQCADMVKFLRIDWERLFRAAPQPAPGDGMSYWQTQ